MSIRRDRLWLLGGVFVIIVIVAVTYLLAIKPIYDDRALKQDQVDDAEVSLINLKHDLASLQAESKKLTTYTAELKQRQKALPATYDVPNFMRQLQDSGNATSVVVSGVSVGAPDTVTDSTTVINVPITLTATGSPANLSKFLNRLQNVQTRAVLVISINLGQGDKNGNMAATMTLNAFCAQNTTTCKTA
jgi:Tfp pilus assembly protein PilO